MSFILLYDIINNNNNNTVELLVTDVGDMKHNLVRNI